MYILESYFACEKMETVKTKKIITTFDLDTHHAGELRWKILRLIIAKAHEKHGKIHEKLWWCIESWQQENILYKSTPGMFLENARPNADLV